MTVDVEDYFHVSAFAKVIKPGDWAQWPSTVERNTRTLLDLFDEFGIKATFFVLGWVAERHVELIREIAARGHEIASHGYSHQLVYRQSPIEFREETARSKKLLEDIGGPQNITEENFPEVHIRGDVNTPYQCIGGVIYTMQYAGFQKIGFISEPAPGSGTVGRL